MSKCKVICDIPKVGLGNQLFPILKSSFFALKNQLPLIVTGYHQFKIGPYLRGERTKRKYKGFFTFEKSLIKEQLNKFKWKRSPLKIYNPSLNLTLNKSNKKDVCYVFNEIPDWNNYFDEIRDFRSDIIALLWKMLQPSIKEQLSKLPKPYIGLHMRMGDFKKLSEGVDFNTAGVTRTPEDYFIQVIADIRRLHGKDLPVSIFTDGWPDEIKKLLSIGNIHIIEGNNDLVDLLLLSKSKIIITSAGSTFSYWAGFLSQAPIIMHPSHIYQPIRRPEDGLYEGPLNAENKILVQTIKSIEYAN